MRTQISTDDDHCQRIHKGCEHLLVYLLVTPSLGLSLRPPAHPTQPPSPDPTDTAHLWAPSPSDPVSPRLLTFCSPLPLSFPSCVAGIRSDSQHWISMLSFGHSLYPSSSAMVFWPQWVSTLSLDPAHVIQLVGMEGGTGDEQAVGTVWCLSQK